MFYFIYYTIYLDWKSDAWYIQRCQIRPEMSWNAMGTIAVAAEKIYSVRQDVAVTARGHIVNNLYVVDTG